MTFAQRRYRLTTHFSERIRVVKWRITVLLDRRKLAQTPERSLWYDEDKFCFIVPVETLIHADCCAILGLFNLDTVRRTRRSRSTEEQNLWKDEKGSEFHLTYISYRAVNKTHKYVGESNENLKYFYLVIYWTQKVHNDFIFPHSLHCVPYKCSSTSEVHGYL
jgi:hypothetical protein